MFTECKNFKRKWGNQMIRQLDIEGHIDIGKRLESGSEFY